MFTLQRKCAWSSDAITAAAEYAFGLYSRMGVYDPEPILWNFTDLKFFLFCVKIRNLIVQRTRCEIKLFCAWVFSLPFKFLKWALLVWWNNINRSSLNGIFINFPQRPFVVHVDELSTESFSPKCRVNSSVTYPGLMNVHVDILETVKTSFSYIELFLQSDNGAYDLAIMNRTVDMCRFFRDVTYEPILQVGLRLYKSNSNFLTSCVIKKDLVAPAARRHPN